MFHIIESVVILEICAADFHYIPRFDFHIVHIQHFYIPFLSGGLLAAYMIDYAVAILSTWSAVKRNAFAR